MKAITTNRSGVTTIPFFRAGVREMSLTEVLTLLGVC